MTRISVGTRVQVEMGERLIPGVVLFHHFASNRAYDLYTLRVAEYCQTMQRWQVSEYGPVQSCKLTRRETIIPELDQDGNTKDQTFTLPQWVELLQG
jgi:hypothetical protein